MKFLMIVLTLLSLNSNANSFSIDFNGKHFTCTEGSSAASSGKTCRIVKRGSTDAQTEFKCSSGNFCSIIVKYKQVVVWNYFSNAGNASDWCDYQLQNN